MVVRQEKTAASRGLERSNFVAREEMMDTVIGECLGFLEAGGAKMEAPSRAAFILAVFICQEAPCKVCQA